MAKDFFDEEFDKKTSESNGSTGGSWFDRPAPQAEQTKSNKRFYITIVCLAVVLCIALGWVLCTVFQGALFSYNTDNDGIVNYGDDILKQVIAYLRNNYYMDIDEEKWLEAIEYSGSALMYKAGDRYSQLMSPQSYYDFLYPKSSASSASDEMFGVYFSVREGVCLYVSSVVANSGAYGKIFIGDLVLKLTDMEDKDGNAPTVDGVRYDEMVIADYSSEVVSDVLDVTHKATFHVLRQNGESYEMHAVELTRQTVTPVVTNYPFNFVEFYFNDQYRNVSVPSKKDAQGNYVFTEGEYTTYEERHLNELPDGTGYVRIDQFMDYTKIVNGAIVKVSASEEFKQVMDLFKERGLTRLVLDLKGNPGGNVSYVCDVAAMLVNASKLTTEERAKVMNGDGELLITTLKFPKFNYVQTYSRASTYSDYFGALGEKCSIVLWTDGGSASASELLTGALTDYRTAVQMGTTTYGKGIAQTWEALPFYGTVKDLNGKEIQFPWAIYYTCANYFSPFGNNIHGEGYTPQNGYNGLKTYAELWQAAKTYWNA